MLLKKGDLQNRLKESETKLSKANERLESFSTSNTQSSKEVDKLRQNETRAIKELNSLKLELAETRDKYERERSELEAQVADLTQQLSVAPASTESITLNERLINELREENEKQKREEERLRNELTLLQSNVSSSLKNSEQYHHNPADSIPNEDVPQLMMKLIEIEQKLADKEKEASESCVALEQLKDKLNKSTERQREIEKQMKESEMQVKILNDLREKDTQRHVKCK